MEFCFKITRRFNLFKKKNNEKLNKNKWVFYGLNKNCGNHLYYTLIHSHTHACTLYTHTQNTPPI